MSTPRVAKPRKAAAPAEGLPAPEPVVDDFAPIAHAAIPEESDAGLFDDLDDEAGAAIPTLAPYTRPDDGIVMDVGLTPSEKAQFVRLLNQFLPLKDRALQLAKLAMYTDTKRAAVGLRAIQEINAITGMSGSAPTEITPMFALPPDTRVNVTVTKVVK